MNGYFSYVGNIICRFAELQELVARVERGAVDLQTSYYDRDGLNTAAERLEHGEIESKAVIRP